MSEQCAHINKTIITLTDDEINVVIEALDRLYDRECGYGTTEHIIKHLLLKLGFDVDDF